MEDEIIQDEIEEQQTQDNQIPDDASDDDLTLEELNQVNDDDFTGYHTGDVSAKEIREKYHFKTDIEEPSEPDTPEEQQKDGNNAPEGNTEPDTPEDEAADYKSAWEQISKPFKANGKMYQPQTPQDVVSLMQKGVNYTQKMQQIAPFRKVIETLKSNNIDENELNFLLDLHNGNKDAINSLLKRNKYDAMNMDYDADKPDTYIPNNNMVSDQQAAISEIVEDLGNNKDAIADIVYNKWDKESQRIFAEHPEYLRLLNEELNLGRFDAIQEQVEQAKMFNRAEGVPDIYLYSAIAKQFQDYAMQQQQLQQQQQQTYQQQQLEQNLRSSKRAAAPSGRAVKSGKGKQYSPDDILNMSEEEFNKIDLDKLLAR